ncbi:hypothetical protein FQA39_LY16197 [Lamprigera yunnana]|nr:hypothetical protein FQA39_LY16197 [Lamprigera yunnana]
MIEIPTSGSPSLRSGNADVKLKMEGKCKVDVEDFEVVHANKDCVEARGVVFNYSKDSRRVNYTVTWKVDLPEETKISINVKKWIKDGYKMPVMKFEKRYKQFLEMDMFGLQELFQEQTKPPLIWPLKKNVPYKTINWHFDGSLFPSGLPTGKWLSKQVLLLPNKTVLLDISFYMTLQYI